jgi:glycosyltransferase involved in cell wall biosynthesis
MLISREKLLNAADGIAVNGRYRVHKVTGVQRYAHEITKRLLKESEEQCFQQKVCVLEPENAKGFRGHLWEQTVLPAVCRGRLLWSPSGNGSAFYHRQVVTFHDLFALEHPEWYGKVYSMWYGFLLKRLATQALHLIAVSEYTRSRLVEVLGCKQERITVIHNGLTSGCERVGPEKIDSARVTLKIPTKRYLLSLSSLEKRKNLQTTLNAWARVHKSLPDDTWLVLAGPAANESVYGRQNLPTDLPRVLYTGYVPEEQLAGLYSGASLFLFPSLAEGFGLPLLEAMACGVRSITSNTTSLPEVGGDVVTYIDPIDDEALAAAICREMRAGASPDNPHMEAIKRARGFNWDDAALKTRAVLEAAVALQGSRASQTKLAVYPRPIKIIRDASDSFEASAVSPIGDIREDIFLNEKPRVALVHDWLTGMRGGEKVLELLCLRFPSAPLWTLLHRRGKVSAAIEARPIHTSLLQYMPFSAKQYRSYLPFFPIFAELNKAGRDSDIVISTSHAVAKAMVVRDGSHRPVHVCYIHTPMRYVWDMFEEYFGAERVGSLLSKSVFAPVAKLLQIYDIRTLHRVDLFIANSTYVAERVQRIYKREAIVVNPPVDIERFKVLKREPEDWYLVVSAMVPYKRVDQAMRAAASLGKRLKLVGDGPDVPLLKRLGAKLGCNVEFEGFVSDANLGDYYRRARALLFPGIEDFGIVPVEAIASGCPVIAFGSGGILDSMTEDTAVLYREPTWEALRQAMLTFESRIKSFEESKLRARAEIFSEERFLQNFEAALGLVANYSIKVPPLISPEYGLARLPSTITYR